MEFSILIARYFRQSLVGLAVLFCATILVACGGAATSGGSVNSSGLTLTLTDASGNQVTNMVVGSSYTLTATITPNTGVAISSVIVTFTSGSGATLSPTAGTALSNSSGVATIVLVPATAGAATATASASVIKTTTIAATATTPASTTTTTVAVSGGFNYSVATVSSSSASLALAFLDSGGNTVNSMTMGTNYSLRATATDNSNPSNNTIVTFAPSSSASLIPAAGTALTNGSGIATVVFVPGTAGANTASASFTSSTGSTISKSINFSIAATPTTTLGSLTPSSSYLSSAGTTTLSINTLVSSALTSGVTVLFSASCGRITTTNPATSNSSGVATATYSSTSASGSLCSGTVTLQATAGLATSNATITVASPVITLNSFAASPSSISSGANSTLSMAVQTNGATPTSTVSVSLSATCGQVSPSVATTDGSGNISATYSSVKSDGTLCQGTDTISAAASGVTASTTVTVAAPTSGAITFVSASPTQIFLKDSGATAVSLLTFKSTYSNGSAAASTSVKFTLTGNPGGVTFGTSSNTAAYTVTSDSLGQATVLVYAGNVAGAVTIKAEWSSNSAITTTSNGLTVASGLPQQKSLTLTASKYNMDAWQYDGDTTTITARVADANGNPVPDGTVINFVTSGGQINRSCSTSTANTGGTNASGFSQCSVILMGQNPRPTNGRVVVLAYLEGVKNYTDANGNGTYDTGDTLTDMGDAYRDDNENGVYDSANGEFLISKGGTGACANGNGLSTGGSGTGGISTTGYGGSIPARGSTCDSNLAGTVRRQIVIFFSSYNAVGTAVTTSSFTGGATPTPFRFYLNSSGPTGSLIPLPSGTTVSAAITSPATGCSASDLSPSSIGNSTYTGTSATENVGSSYPFTVTLTGTASVNCAGATLKISYTTSVSGASNFLNFTIP